MFGQHRAILHHQPGKTLESTHFVAALESTLWKRLGRKLHAKEDAKCVASIHQLVLEAWGASWPADGTARNAQTTDGTKNARFRTVRLAKPQGQSEPHGD